MDLGVIEGFYGPTWDNEARLSVLRHLSSAGYGFYHYAPKADPSVRERWRASYSSEAATQLDAIRRQCHVQGMRFGIGITPVGIALPPTPGDRDALASRLDELNELGVDELLIGFDDTSGARSDLAARQIELVDWMAERTHAQRVVVCPTYYSDDPLLDELFGPRPPDYLATLGAGLDRAIDIYWAGPAICPRAITPDHIDRVSDHLRRRPLLWDNYPVNDSPSMADHLHLRATAGRPASLASRLAGHAVNPALQPTLSLVPALALSHQYRSEGDPDRAFQRAAETVLGAGLAAAITADLGALQDTGRKGLSATAHASLLARYQAYDHPAAREIVAWLNGGYAADAPTDG